MSQTRKFRGVIKPVITATTFGGMQRFQEDDFRQRLATADSVEFGGFTQPDNKTRAGSYLVMRHGIATPQVVFIGIALDEGNQGIIEVVS